MSLRHGGVTGNKFAQHVGDPVPATNLEIHNENSMFFNMADWRGRAYIVNFFASWCVECRAEHDAWMALSTYHLPVIGIAFKDKQELLTKFLDKSGNPYLAVARDDAGRAGIDWGITGVPETFIIDKAGIIRFHIAGPMNDATLSREFADVWKKVSAEDGK